VRAADALVPALAMAAVVLLGGCGAGSGVGTTPGTAATSSPVPVASASPGGGSESSPAAVASPVEGVIVKIDSQGLTKIAGFRLRSPGGTETDFTIGVLENGVEFPPGHLAEHMATSSPIRVFFRDEGGSLVVYRIEDAEQG
jgi:hypothetical protein